MPTNEQISVVLTANIDNYKKNMSIATEALVELQKQSALFVKINQSVADSFTKIDFAAKQFGETVGVLEKKLEVIKKGMTSLAVAGEQNTRAFKDLDNQYRIITNRIENKAMAEAQAYAAANMANSILPQTKKGLDAASESLKKSNIQWTSLALVVQDLPFGFRGIQNNLPALFGSLATGTGEAYFAFSALIAVITAWDMGVFGAKKSVDAFAESTKKLNDEVKNSINYSNSNIQRLQALVTIGNDYTKSESLRAKALKEIKNELGKVNKAEADKIKNIGDGTQAVYTYIAAIRAQQLAEVTGKKIAELQLQISEDRNKIASATGKGIHILDWLGLTDSDIQVAQNRVIQAEGLLNRLQDLQISATIQGMNNPYTKTAAPAKGKESKKPKETYYLEELKAKQKAYQDDILLYYDYGNKIIAEEKRLDLIQASLTNASSADIISINETTKAKILANKVDLSKKIAKLVEDDVNVEREAAEKIAQIQIQNRLDITHALTAINTNFVNDDLDIIKNNTKEALKANKGRYRSQLDVLKKAGVELQAERVKALELGVPTDKVDKAIEENKSAIISYGDTWKATSDKINNAIESMLEGGISRFAENLGQALAGNKVDLFGGFLSILSEGLTTIGKALIAYGVAMDAFKKAFENPFAAIAAGIGLIVIGSFIGAKVSQMSGSNNTKANTPKFANGGIVSGPTMGLMGEYPGAQNNPEVIAPLDKLKGLMGGGGTLEARISGNDLLVLVNRAQRNNNQSF